MLKIAGIYGLFEDGKLNYIGESSNTYARIGAHINNDKLPFNDVRIYHFDSDYYTRLDIEACLIQEFVPPYNKKHVHEFAKGRDMKMDDFEHECRIMHARVSPNSILKEFGYESAAEFIDWWEKHGRKQHAKTTIGRVYRELYKALERKERNRW